jgi:alpha-mannosidase
LKNSVNVLSSQLNTQVKNRAVVVYNPVASDREDLVTIEMAFSKVPGNVAVFDQNGKETPSQIVDRKENTLEIIFLARVPSIGMATFDIRESATKSATVSAMKVTSRSLENAYYLVKIADNGDIQSIYDKVAKTELLAKPAALDFQQEQPRQFPSWNMDWKDRQKPPIAQMNENATISILEEGPVRIALQVKRKGMNSEISQIYSLAAGEAGKHLEVTNKIDWQSKEVSLKAAFPLAVSNDNATYNLGVGTLERGNNSENKFEVPSKEWFDLTDKSGKYGVTILEDCKYGSDKPDNNTLRLTLLYTPKATSYVHEGSQDWGIHDLRYGVYGHTGDWRKGQSQWQGKFFNQPLLAFETQKHNGKLGKSISFVKISSPVVGVMSFKKMEQGDYYILRVNELTGIDQQALTISFPGKITDAFEVNGQEQKLGSVDFSNGKLNFGITHYTIRSFAVKLESPVASSSIPNQVALSLPFNQDAFSFDNNRSDGNFNRGMSFPAELIANEVVSEDIRFKIGNTADEEKNVIDCGGQSINLPDGDFNKLYILASAMSDSKGSFIVDKDTTNIQVQAGIGFIGQFYNRVFAGGNYNAGNVESIKGPFVKKDNIGWFASHRHVSYPSRNDAFQYCYIYKYEINLPKGARNITLPASRNIKVFAITLASNKNDNAKPLQPLYDNFEDASGVQIRK